MMWPGLMVGGLRSACCVCVSIVLRYILACDGPWPRERASSGQGRVALLDEHVGCPSSSSSSSNDTRPMMPQLASIAGNASYAAVVSISTRMCSVQRPAGWRVLVSIHIHVEVRVTNTTHRLTVCLTSWAHRPDCPKAATEAACGLCALRFQKHL